MEEGRENLIDESNEDIIVNESLDDKIESNEDKPKDSSSENKAVFLKNVSIVFLSNIFSAISGILIGFVVPKILSIDDYGYYETFTLYSSYIGLLHFGFIDGIFLLYAGRKFEELDKEKFRTYTRFIFLLELCFTVLCIITSLFFLKTDTFLILLFVSANILLTNMLSYFEFICQVTMKFKQKSIRKVIMCVLNIITVGVLFLLYFFDIATISGGIYILITLLINFVVLIWYMISFRQIIFGRSSGIIQEKSNIFYLIKVGFPLLITNLVTQYIFIVDRQIINIFFDNTTFSTYAFAYNMINVITIATSAISVVFYPTIKRMSEKEVITKYTDMNAYLLIFLAFCLFAYYPVELIVNGFLDKYSSSLPVFRVVLPGVVVSSCITSIKYNCYKSFNKIRTFFITSTIILILSAVFDLVVYYIYKEPIPIAIASIVVLFIWYLAVEIPMYIKYKVKWVRNFIYLICSIALFYGMSFIPNIYVSMILFIPAMAVLTFVIYSKLIIDLMSNARRRFFKK